MKDMGDFYQITKKEADDPGGSIDLFNSSDLTTFQVTRFHSKKMCCYIYIYCGNKYFVCFCEIQFTSQTNY
ncbi:MAG: Unknown protein [uncultured Aureispira sp.]|uniref:Uncharacterized protein n=1 Tax=uncultured Aureispira sp. TaxID=1331704 RepID=A0A6S6TS02_9BACT|nr:MAG: Unknown protein [uncultured Aureispira sp.]